MCNIDSLPDFFSLKAVSKKEIQRAENILNVSFSSEYHNYIASFGAASVLGHELTGICESKRLNVVDVTLSEREYNPDVPKDWYVLEQTNVDSIVIWQNSKGEVYQTCPGCEAEKIADSIIEYLKLDEE